MRILHVSHAIPPDANTGVENYTLGLARAQRKAGHTLALFARGFNKSVPAETVESNDIDDGIRAVRVHFGSGHQHTTQRIRLGLDVVFRRFLEEWKPDVVHFQHLLYHSLAYPRIAREAGAATLLTLHDLWFTCPVVQRRDFAERLCQLDPGLVCAACVWGGKKAQVLPPPLLRRLADTVATRPLLQLLPTSDELMDWTANSARALCHVDTLIAPSQFVRDDLTRRGIRHPDLIVNDIGIPRPDLGALKAVEAARPSDGLLHFGIIGSNPLKGPAVAVEAFRRLPPELPVRLHLWGTDTFPNLPPNVTVEGRYTSADLEQVYGSFDVLIMASLWYENAPAVIREAFARHRPVIASNIGGMAESVRDQIDGLHFAVGDADALAKAVRRLVEQPALLAELRDGIRPPKFYEEHVAEIIALYQSARQNKEQP